MRPWRASAETNGTAAQRQIQEKIFSKCQYGQIFEALGVCGQMEQMSLVTWQDQRLFEGIALPRKGARFSVSEQQSLLRCDLDARIPALALLAIGRSATYGEPAYRRSTSFPPCSRGISYLVTDSKRPVS